MLLIKYELLTRRMVKTGSVVLLVALMTSCGAAKIAYNSLDIIIPWFLDDYVSFNETQEQAIATILNQQLEWHRETQLPGYIQLLDKIQQDAKINVNKDQVTGYYNTTQNMWRTMAVRLTPDVATVLATLDDEQVKELIDSLKYENEELKSEFVDQSPEELQEGRIDRMIDRFERWLDELTPQQEKAVIAWSHELKPISEYWFENRMHWFNEFRVSLNLRKNEAQFYNSLHRLFVQYENLQTPAYVTALNYNKEKTINLIITIEQQLTDEQRVYLIKEIEDIKHDLIDLNGA